MTICSGWCYASSLNQIRQSTSYSQSSVAEYKRAFQHYGRESDGETWNHCPCSSCISSCNNRRWVCRARWGFINANRPQMLVKNRQHMNTPFEHISNSAKGSDQNGGFFVKRTHPDELFRWKLQGFSWLDDCHEL